MQVRVALAAFAATFFAIGGTVVTRALQTPYSCSRVFENLRYFAYVEGNVRGKLILLAPGKTREQATSLDMMEVAGPGTTQTATVGIKTCPDGTHLGPELARVQLTLGQSQPIRDKSGKLLLTAYLVPLTPEEDRQAKELVAEDEKRVKALYQNPACISRDSYRTSFGGVTQLPGLVAWTMNLKYDSNGRLLINPNGKPSRLESGGFGWKVLGDAKVTLRLLVDHTKPPFVDRYATRPRREALAWINQPELRALALSVRSTPKIYWSQSAAGTPPRAAHLLEPGMPQPKLRQLGEYWLDENGCWLQTARSGEFTGYGKHVITDRDGTPQLILEVSPLD